MIERITREEKLYAVVIRASYQKDGIEFFTPSHFSQQLGYMNRPKGYVVPAHKHKKVKREVSLTQEVLFIKSGKVKANFYTNEQELFKQIVLEEGDTILLAEGGHGFEMLEQSEIIEVKQGPYCGDEDKTRF